MTRPAAQKVSAAPGGVANGSFWFDTDDSKLYVRRSGSWGHVATIPSGGGAAQLYIYMEYGTLFGGSFSGYETVYVSGTCTYGGGAGGNSYSWIRTGGNADICSDPGNSPSISGSVYYTTGDLWETWAVTVIDSAGVSASAPVAVSVVHY